MKRKTKGGNYLSGLLKAGTDDTMKTGEDTTATTTTDMGNEKTDTTETMKTDTTETMKTDKVTTDTETMKNKNDDTTEEESNYGSILGKSLFGLKPKEKIETGETIREANEKIDEKLAQEK